MKRFFASYKSNVVLLFITVFCMGVIIKNVKYKKEGYFRYDVAGYYLYLPATFIFQDHSQYHFYDSLSTKYSIVDYGGLKYGLIFQKQTNKYSNIYPIGVAMMQLPFYLMADGYSILFDPYHRDGFYHPYQLALIIGSIFYCLFGFLFLRKFLRNFFNDNIIAICISILFFGTNLLYYTAYEAGMSHVYSFCLIAVFLHFLHSYFTLPNFKKNDGIGFCFWIHLYGKIYKLFYYFICYFLARQSSVYQTILSIAW